MSLTDTAIKAAKPSGKPVKMSDGRVPAGHGDRFKA
jgi:hypothetical protein